MSKITGFSATDVRFPTSQSLDGSDAMSPDPDYSVAYLRISTDASDDLEGHGFVFTTRDRPVRSARGWSAAPVRHGVSTIRSGERFTIGLVFHDAA